MRIYTRTGDGGETGLFGGERVGKDHPRIAACGDVDELNAAIGVALSEEGLPAGMAALLRQVQNDLFVLGADLATPPGMGGTREMRVRESMPAALEPRIDDLEAELEPLRQFVLPGGHPAAARLHLARAICRRAERAVAALAGREEINPELLVYLNRLSDLLFVMARAANAVHAVPDIPWEQGKTG